MPLERIAAGASLLLPAFLLHGRSIADAMIVLTDLCFLAHCVQAREWRWLQAGWAPLGFAWSGWVIVCSVLMWEGGVAQAVVQLRFVVFVAALEHFVLREAWVRVWLGRAVTACAAWIAAHSLIQLSIGHNLFGHGRGPAGELTGPFDKPRAGPPLARIMPPVLVPPAAALLERARRAATLGAYALLLGGMLLMVLMNQRMPVLLTASALAVSAVLLPRLRPVVVAAGVAAVLLVAASAVVSPPTYQRLVLQFSHQMEAFGSSHYGLIYARSSEIARQHPLAGLGFDGFRHGCPDPRYFRPSFDGAQPEGGGAAICTQHPHNFYAEALTNGGLPGLALFAALALAWLIPLGRGLWRVPDPLRVSLFASILVQLWPIQSTSSFTTMPMGGWFFLLLGWALAEARWRGNVSQAKGA